MAQSTVSLPPDLLPFRDKVEEYVSLRIKEFASGFTARYCPELGEEEVQSVINQLVPQPETNAEATGAPLELRLQLSFQHDCLALGCRDSECTLCQYNPLRVCSKNFCKKYLVGDVLKSNCGAGVKVELQTSRGQRYQDDLPAGMHFEISLIDGVAFKDKGGEIRTLTSDELKSCIKFTNHRDEALLQPKSGTSSSNSNRKVLLRAEKGMITLPELQVTDSSEALLTGRKPPFRLVVYPAGEGQHPAGPQFMYAVSEEFVVATRRVKQANKAEIPLMDDHVSKIEHIGRETVKKLQDMRAAAMEIGTTIQLPEKLMSVTTVGQFVLLVELAEKDAQMKKVLQVVLKLSKEKWEEAAAHALQAVVSDFRKRIWYPPGHNMNLGILFNCKYGAVQLKDPVVLVQLNAASSSHKLTPEDELDPTSLTTLKQLKSQAVAAWWEPQHPGWGIYKEPAQDIRRDFHSQQMHSQQTHSLQTHSLQTHSLQTHSLQTHSLQQHSQHQHPAVSSAGGGVFGGLSLSNNRAGLSNSSLQLAAGTTLHLPQALMHHSQHHNPHGYPNKRPHYQLNQSPAMQTSAGNAGPLLQTLQSAPSLSSAMLPSKASGLQSFAFDTTGIHAVSSVTADSEAIDEDNNAIAAALQALQRGGTFAGINLANAAAGLVAAGLMPAKRASSDNAAGENTGNTTITAGGPAKSGGSTPSQMPDASQSQPTASAARAAAAASSPKGKGKDSAAAGQDGDGDGSDLHTPFATLALPAGLQAELASGAAGGTGTSAATTTTHASEPMATHGSGAHSTPLPAFAHGSFGDWASASLALLPLEHHHKHEHDEQPAPQQQQQQQQQQQRRQHQQQEAQQGRGKGHDAPQQQQQPRQQLLLRHLQGREHQMSAPSGMAGCSLSPSAERSSPQGPTVLYYVPTWQGDAREAGQGSNASWPPSLQAIPASNTGLPVPAHSQQRMHGQQRHSSGNSQAQLIHLASALQHQQPGGHGQQFHSLGAVGSNLGGLPLATAVPLHQTMNLATPVSNLALANILGGQQHGLSLQPQMSPAPGGSNSVQLAAVGPGMGGGSGTIQLSGAQVLQLQHQLAHLQGSGMLNGSFVCVSNLDGQGGPQS